MSWQRSLRRLRFEGGKIAGTLYGVVFNGRKEKVLRFLRLLGTYPCEVVVRSIALPYVL